VSQTTVELPNFHPQTLLRDWGNGQGFRLADDIHKQIELRRAKERAAAPVNLTKETPPVRQ
jgi:hypothetical protein